MKKEDIERLQNLAGQLKRINKKVKLLSLLRRAKVEFSQNKLAESEYSCNQVLKTEPNNPVALRGLGCIEQTRGNFQKAIQYYNKALEFSRNKEIEYTLLGSIYYLQDDLENAIKFYNLAIDFNDDYDPAYEGRNQSMLESHLKIVDLQDELIRREIF